MNPIQQHQKVANQTMDMKNEEVLEDDELIYHSSFSHLNITKKTSISFLNFYRKSNWLHEFKSDEQLWEEFMEQEGKEKGCPFDEPIYNPEKQNV